MIILTNKKNKVFNDKFGGISTYRRIDDVPQDIKRLENPEHFKITEIPDFVIKKYYEENELNKTKYCY